METDGTDVLFILISLLNKPYLKSNIMKLFITILLSLMSCIASAQENKTNWETLSDYKVPEWFQDAKFGIYFHWGVYSVPEFQTEWYPRYLYFPWSDVHKHHEKTFVLSLNSVIMI